MHGQDQELIVFPSELSKRRFQQDMALKQGWIDASGHTTFARLRKLCLPYAPLKGVRMNPVQELLLKREVAEVASGHFENQPGLGALSEQALSDVLERLVAELAALPESAPSIVEWLGDPKGRLKLRQLGLLGSIWRAKVKEHGYADPIAINLALLRLLNGPREQWPPQLRKCRQLTFKSVRWFNPFEESCVVALNRKLRIRIESALPPAHAEAAADRLGQRIRSEIMAEPWASWAENLSDALAVDSPDMLLPEESSKISFSRSAGAYGEIEDLARRICRHLETADTPPHRIALVVPDIGAAQDIIPHVFSRFRIPYYFRRGRPVLSSPCVKAFLAWLAFPLRPDRDVLIDLVRNPAIRIPDREDTAAELLKCPPLLEAAGSDRFAREVAAAFHPADSGLQAARILQERIIEPDDHFNREALNALAAALEGFGEQRLPLRELVGLVEKLLENATVRPRDSHEQGVWILNPLDAVGLEFDLVCFAGLNEGEFPGIPRQDALLNDQERSFLLRHLEAMERELPAMALPQTRTQRVQESVVFLSALGMACDHLVLSCQAVDQEGNEKSESEYFRKLWNLAGWAAQETVEADAYDAWRIDRLGEESIFAAHLQKQQQADSEDRVPMPGESFLPVVPLPLCRAKDEALQTAFQGRSEIDEPDDDSRASNPLPIPHLVSMLNIEAERDAYLDQPDAERQPSRYCGHIGALTEKVADWLDQREELSPTALESLAMCRYLFLLERVFGLKDERAVDDTPDPMMRGGLIHSILFDIYNAVAGGDSGIDLPRYWAVKSAEGWIRRTDGGADAVPLATFLPEYKEAYEALARRIAGRRLDRSQLGHPGVWSAEREKVMETVLNFVRYDVETCSGENRYPACFELTFGGDTAVDLGVVKLRGKIDRVDLIFGETGMLQRIRVLDYKGAGRVRTRKEEYREEIHHNLDCQLPVYACAAQHHFLGEGFTPAANAMTEAGYLFCQRRYDDVGKTLSRSLISLDEEGLVEGFLATLRDNIRRLKTGDFSVDPLIGAYNDYQSICRTENITINDLISLSSA